MQTQVIAVNATALKDGGALSILKQFIAHIPLQGIFYIFIHPDVVLDNKAQHVHLIPIDCSSAFKRLLWDAFGFKRWLDERHLKAGVVVSLQNTSVAYDKQVKQVIYLHQGLCLYPQTWSFFKKSERRFAFYKSIYPLFIFLFAQKNTRFIVQTRWMKEALCQKFKVLSEHVHVIKPDIIRVAVDEVQKKVLSHPHVLFYPV
ncbi:MAG: glycosyl transferase, partial [Legionellaceae bacterium]